MADDLCQCGHAMVWHGESGCEDCLCEKFRWPDEGCCGRPDEPHYHRETLDGIEWVRADD